MQIGKILKDRCRNNKGFTLIEIISVLVILGIIGVVAISRMTSTAEVDLKAKAEALKGHIRYTQMRAMNMTCDTAACVAAGCKAAFGISTIANPYYMFRDCTIASKVALPGASGNTIALSGMTLAATNAPNNVITFDDWGRPCTDLLGTTLAASDITLTLTSGTQSETITIAQNTGYVP